MKGLPSSLQCVSVSITCDPSHQSLGKSVSPIAQAPSAFS